MITVKWAAEMLAVSPKSLDAGHSQGLFPWPTSRRLVAVPAFGSGSRTWKVFKKARADETAREARERLVATLRAEADEGLFEQGNDVQDSEQE